MPSLYRLCFVFRTQPADPPTPPRRDCSVTEPFLRPNAPGLCVPLVKVRPARSSRTRQSPPIHSWGGRCTPLFRGCSVRSCRTTVHRRPPGLVIRLRLAIPAGSPGSGREVSLARSKLSRPDPKTRLSTSRQHVTALPSFQPHAGPQGSILPRPGPCQDRVTAPSTRPSRAVTSTVFATRSPKRSRMIPNTSEAVKDMGETCSKRSDYTSQPTPFCTSKGADQRQRSPENAPFSAFPHIL